MKKLVLCAALLSSPLLGQDDPAGNVSEQRLRADIDTLVGFGTRHTLSEQDNPKRGIGAAIDWAATEFRRISTECDGCLEVAVPERMVSGRRIPDPVRLRNVIAIQKGSERPNEVVIVQGHIDSRASDPFDWQSDAPGANDDGSGTVLTIEAARVLSRQQYPTTIIYALLSGEEQGLYGGQLMADWVESQGYTVKAVLNNDIVGGSCGSDGYCDDQHVRVFSEGPRADLTDQIRADQRRNGGENDSPARNLSRWLDRIAEGHADGLDVRQIWRTDRMARGGDQIPFLEKGYPAVRITVAVEDYDHQHQDLRTEDGTIYGDTPDEMDFPYLAKVTQFNVRALDQLARAPMPPVPTAQAAVRTDTLIEWAAVPGATTYAVAKRRTDEPYWRDDAALVSLDGLAETNVDAADDGRTLTYTAAVRGDDWIFGVRACAHGSVCSPYASAVPAGAFAPIDKPDDDSE